ncbi:MAG: sulfotransferase domain-containing protein [Candidatus Delongbacteria bacterium]|nr:sulfotransferase domain-containing protein [Candidatus Delongbacteria bacterium]
MIGFFIVGHPKCGTTFIYNVLSHHPNIFLPNYKEPKYFSTDLHFESDSYHGRRAFYPIRTEKEYLKLYEKANSSIMGDVSPIYLFSHNAAKNIYTYNLNAKIIILLREPVSFLRSLHNQQVFNLAEDEQDFIKALSMEETRKRGDNIPKYVQAPRYLYYSEWVDYRSQIQRYSNLFDINNIKIYLFEDLIANEKEFIQDLFSFIGVTEPGFSFPEDVFMNPSKEIRFKMIHKISKMAYINFLINRILPKTMFGHISNMKNKLFSKKAQKVNLSPDQIHQIQKKFVTNVIETEAFVKEIGLGSYDLVNKWGYGDL